MSFLTIEQAAVRLAISRTTVWRLVRRGGLRAHRFGGCIRIDEKDLEAFVAKCKTRPLAYIPTARRAKALEAADSFAAKTKRQALSMIAGRR